MFGLKYLSQRKYLYFSNYSIDKPNTSTDTNPFSLKKSGFDHSEKSLKN